MWIGPLSVLLSLTIAPRSAYAEETRRLEGREILPPDPSDRRPVRGVEVRFNLPVPVYTRPLCPEGAACILGVGAGFGVAVERRFQGGLAVGGSYELGLNSAQAVYELATLQSLGGRLRWVFNPTGAAHPTLELGLGAVGIGNVFRVDSVGPYLDVASGGELEMNHTLAFTLGLRIRGMTFVPFHTDQDGVRRSVSPYLDLVATIQAGILWLKPRGRDR